MKLRGKRLGTRHCCASYFPPWLQPFIRLFLYAETCPVISCLFSLVCLLKKRYQLRWPLCRHYTSHRPVYKASILISSSSSLSSCSVNMSIGFGLLLISVHSWSMWHGCNVLCVQVACCCGSAACSCCCNCCPKIKQSTGTRVMYALYFLLVTIICVIMMSPTVEQEIKTHVSTRIADPKFPLSPF